MNNPRLLRHLQNHGKLKLAMQINALYVHLSVYNGPTSFVNPVLTSGFFKFVLVKIVWHITPFPQVWLKM